MAELSAAGFPLCIVTNQSGIGRALYSELDYVRTTLKMGTPINPGVIRPKMIQCA